MDLLSYPGRAVYALVVGFAFLGGLFVSFVTLFGLAWGRISSVDYLTAIFGNLATVGLLVGLIGCISERKSIVIITFLGAAFVPLNAILYAQLLTGAKIPPGSHMPVIWIVFLVIDITCMLCAFSKFQQLRSLR
jgi:hypothetical protein